MTNDLIAYLISQPAIAALVVAGGQDRVFPIVRPQGSKLPAVVVTRISGAPEASDEGDAGISSNRVQVDCYAETVKTVQQLAGAVSASLSGKSFTHGATEFQGVFTEDESDTDETTSTGVKVYRTRFDYMIWHKGA